MSLEGTTLGSPSIAGSTMNSTIQEPPTTNDEGAPETRCDSRKDQILQTIDQACNQLQRLIDHPAPTLNQYSLAASKLAIDLLRETQEASGTIDYDRFIKDGWMSSHMQVYHRTVHPTRLQWIKKRKTDWSEASRNSAQQSLELELGIPLPTAVETGLDLIGKSIASESQQLPPDKNDPYQMTFLSDLVWDYVSKRLVDDPTYFEDTQHRYTAYQTEFEREMRSQEQSSQSAKPKKQSWYRRDGHLGVPYLFRIKLC
ncbi:uncharacterized protein L199_001263 [Kwoniella botswanensis]|uniref:uncharacterized protein n=1 Tax=Kwoniella botswanensis TaxID=1268659 RepID=UPI00315D94DF